MDVTVSGVSAESVVPACAVRENAVIRKNPENVCLDAPSNSGDHPEDLPGVPPIAT